MSRFAAAFLIAAVLSVTSALSWPGASRAQVPPGTKPDELLESRFAVLQDTDADRLQIKPGDEFTLALRLTIFKGADFEFHTYGAQITGNADYIASVLMMDPADGVTWSDPVWPEGELTKSPGGKMYILTGQPVITITGKLAADAQPGPREFGAQMLISACTEDMCLPPSQIALKWKLEVVPSDYAGQIAVQTKEQLLAPVPYDANRFHVPTQAEADAAAAGEPAPTTDEVETPQDGEAAQPDNAAITGGTGPVDWDKLEVQTQTKQISIWRILLFALLGGLILNIMPCVLPVVSIKVISLARQAEESPRTIALHSLLFSLGIISAFAALAAVVAVIQAGGTQLGWGFQFQNPTFLIVMASIIFVFGLSLAGVFTIKPPQALTATGEKLAEGETLGASYFKGILATVLGTPCVGPFLGPALGYAFTRSSVEVLLIFITVGVGMALPYIFLVLNPRFLRMGRRERGELSRKIMASKGWLVDFERVMAFMLFFTTVYLLYILAGVSGAIVVVWALAFLVALGFAAWLWGRLVTLGKRGVLIGIPAVLLVILVAGWFCNRQANLSFAAESETELDWQPFHIQDLQDAVADGQTVLVDFTADWCPNCKYNEATALNIEDTKKLVEDLDVVVLQADWTSRNKEIGWALRKLGFASVPLTAIFPASDPSKPYLLDGVYTPARLHDTLKAAAAE